MSRALEDLPDSPLEKMDPLFDWEQFREPLLRAWPWASEDGHHRGRPYCGCGNYWWWVRTTGTCWMSVWKSMVGHSLE